MFSDLLLIGFSLLAAISPLLVLAYLWQLKEWRWDRLMEHLHRENAFSQLFGILRPLILVVSTSVLLIPGTPMAQWSRVAVGLLAILSLARVLLRKQQQPKWTEKALVLVASALLFDLVVLVFLSVTQRTAFFFVAAVLPAIQCIPLALSWLAWRPVDAALKARVLRKARAIRNLREDLVVIGVTGSVGKTTVKELLACILKPLKAVATPAYVNSEMGVARWLISLLSDVRGPIPEVLIVEMGAYRMGEIALLCKIAQPKMAVVTYVGNQHVALFGSEEALWMAKSEIVRSLPANGHAFLNGDNESARTMKSVAPCPVTIVGTGGSADIEAHDIEETPKGIKFHIGQHSFETALHGTHNVTNVLLAIAVARQLGMKDADIAVQLRSFTPPRQTFGVRTEHGVTILDDTHNSSPPSVKAVTGWAKGQPFDHKILVMAGLIELGEETERAHRELGIGARDVFERVIFLDNDLAPLFAAGYGRSLEIMGAQTAKVPPGSLLCCCGRMSPSVITRLLP